MVWYIIIAATAIIATLYIIKADVSDNKKSLDNKITNQVLHNELNSTRERLFYLILWSIPSAIAVVCVFIYRDIFKDFQNLTVIIIGAIPACVLWYYRDKAKQIDQKQKYEDQRQKDEEIKINYRDIKIKESNDAWDNFRKYQEIIEDETISDEQKSSAVFAIGKYYTYNDEFPEMVHEFFRNVSDKYWNNIIEYQEYEDCEKEYRYAQDFITDDSIYGEIKERFEAANDNLNRFIKTTELPKYIKTIYKVIKNTAMDKDLLDSSGRNFFSKQCSILGFDNFKLIKTELQDIDLAGGNLTRANLAGANIMKANLSYSNMGQVNLNNADCSGTYLVKANLWQADLRGADLTGTILEKADISWSDFRSTILIGTKFTGANLQGAKMSKSSFNSVLLDKANLSGVDLSETSFRRTKLAGAFYSKNHKNYEDTIFPQNFDPETHNMICLSEFMEPEDIM